MDAGQIELTNKLSGWPPPIKREEISLGKGSVVRMVEGTNHHRLQLREHSLLTGSDLCRGLAPEPT